MSEEYDRLLIANTLPWKRTVSGPVSKYAVQPRGRSDDDLSARHWQDRSFNDAAFLLPRTEIPGNGFITVSTDELHSNEDWPYDERGTVETDAYRLSFDRNTGGIVEWWDKRLDCQWVDHDSNYPLAGIVREELVDTSGEQPRDRLFRAPPAGEDNPDGLWNAAPDLVEADLKSETPRGESKWGYQSDWHANRYGPNEVRRHRVYRTPLGYDIQQELVVDGLASSVELRVFVPHEGTEIHIDATWEESTDTDPASTYLAFPFDIPNPSAHVDVGSQAVQPGDDQLPGSCRDYFTAQRWVDLSNEHRGMTVGCPVNPMVQFGGFRFGEQNSEFTLPSALLLGWVTTNYYNTNFRAHQPGRISARYHLHPHDGPFDEGDAHRVGLTAEQTTPLAQPIADSGIEPTLPERGQILDLPEPPVLVPFIRPANASGIGSSIAATSISMAAEDEFDVGLLNASDTERTARIKPGVLSFIDASIIGVLGKKGDNNTVPVNDGVIEIGLAPRELRVVRLSCEYGR
jgi:alpha-mannosidase